MGSQTRLSSYCTKRANNGVNLVTSRKINMRLARPISDMKHHHFNLPAASSNSSYKELGMRGSDKSWKNTLRAVATAFTGMSNWCQSTSGSGEE